MNQLRLLTLRTFFQKHIRSQSVLSRAADVRVNQDIHGYTVKQVTPVEELQLVALCLEHGGTGAQHVHVAREDNNNVFGVHFRTTPRDSTGVPHILEHTVLCGSQRFPVRDPFFKMLNRSLATFMNAFTASDWTMYPFSTLNAKDFENLMSVYLDAAFFPRLRKLDFMQEGWRLEHQDPQDQTSPLIFKGVVFNEMKGVFSDPQNVFLEQLQRGLLPSHTYGVCSGGDPLHIPDLTWQHLRQFHADHYHPSNSRFFTYGDLPIENHLRTISESVLNKFSRLETNTAVPLQPRWTQPRHKTITCRPDPLAPDPEKQTTVAVSHLLSDIRDPYQTLLEALLCSLLSEGPSSPFARSLLEANLGQDFSPGTGFNGTTRESSFSVGLRGIARRDVDTVLQLIGQTIDDVIRDGFPQERIDSFLHKIEIDLKHQSSTFGLMLLISMSHAWTHDADVGALLRVGETVNRLQKDLRANPRLLQDLTARLFKDNAHRLTLEMSADEQHEERLQQAEHEKLKTYTERLSDAERGDVYRDGLELLQTQMKEENLSCLPSLQLSDLASDVQRVELQQLSSDGIPLQMSIQPTNGVTYFRLAVDMTSLPQDLVPYVPLFCNVITKMGAGADDFRQLSLRAELCTGSLSAQTHICPLPDDKNGMQQMVVFSSHCLDRNISKMLNLWSDILLRPQLQDTDRLLTLVRQFAGEQAASVAAQGHLLAMTAASAGLSPSAAATEQANGMTQVYHMKQLAAEDADLKLVADKLQQLAKLLVDREKARFWVNCVEETTETVLEELHKFSGDLPAANASTEVGSGKAAKQAVGASQIYYALPFQVNYVAQSFATCPYTHHDFASLRILSKLMTAKFLHREIREKGGAYGGGARGSEPGLFSFFSYRDPGCESTLSTFAAARDWAVAGDFSIDDLKEAKFAVFQQVDKPVSPGDRGAAQFYHCLTDDMRQLHRQHLLSVDKEAVISAARSYLSGADGGSAVLGSPNSELYNSGEWKVVSD